MVYLRDILNLRLDFTHKISFFQRLLFIKNTFFIFFVFIFVIVPFIAWFDNIYLFGFPWNRPKLSPNLALLALQSKKSRFLRMIYNIRMFIIKLKKK